MTRMSREQLDSVIQAAAIREQGLTVEQAIGIAHVRLRPQEPARFMPASDYWQRCQRRLDARFGRGRSRSLTNR
jgi:hypothetical protein